MDYSSLSTLIAGYIKDRALVKLEKLDKEYEKDRKNIADPLQLIAFDAEYKIKRNEIEFKFIPSNWLTDAAKRANQISIVTHALKFTHTDAKGSSIYALSLGAKDDGFDDRYLSTSSLCSLETDAVGNAAALDVANLLQLKQNGESLINHIARGDSSPLQVFADSEMQLKSWIDGFGQVLVAKDLASHSLAKQLYFPVSETEYHLLSPLFASSLAQAIHKRINFSRYDEKAKETRKAKRDKKYSNELVVSYTDMVIQNFGGTKPQNVSQLNSTRGGKSYLFSCAPPQWDKKYFEPPMTSKSIFTREYDKQAWRKAKELQNFLLKNFDKNNKQIRLTREKFVDELSNTLLNYAARVQKQQPGWSANCNLPRAQQLWLDPNRSDLEFQKERAKNDWKDEIAGEFADWLNKKIKHEKLDMATPEYLEWQKQFLTKLRALKEDLEVTV